MNELKDEDIIVHDHLADEDIDVHPLKEESSTLSDVGTGLAQGLTFGFSDEALAALKSAYEVATTEKTIKDLPSLYRQFQKVEQEKVARAREQSPYAYTASEFAGALAPALFTGGGSVAARGAAALAEGTALPALATKEAITATAEAAPSFFPSLIKAAKTGAGYGALAAAGTTEKPIEDTGEFAKEIGKGAVAGATFGAGLSGLGALGKAIAPDIEGHAILRQAKKSYEQAKEGAPVFGEAAQATQRIREKTATGELFSELENLQKQAGIAQKTVLEQYQEPLQSLSFSKVINRLGTDIPTQAREHLSFYANKLEKGEITASELNEVKKIIKETVYNYKDKLLPDSLEALKKLGTATEEILNKVPGYEEATRRYHDVLSAVQETITEKGRPAEVRERYLSEISKPKEVLYDQLKNLIRKIGKPGTSADEASTTLLALEENINALREKDPDVFKKLGFDPDLFIKKIKEEADISAISQARRGDEPHTGVLKQALTLFTPRGATYTAAAVAGKAAGVAGKAAQLPVRLASKVYSAAEPELRKVSEALLSNPSTKHFGQNLANSLDKPKGISHRAILFSIMQSPEARDVLTSMYPDMKE